MPWAAFRAKPLTVLEDAVAELDALVVAQGAAELAGNGLRDSGAASEALVVAPDPVAGVTRRRPV